MAAPRILIVEDEGLVALDLKNRLESFGYEVSDMLSSGEMAVEKIETLRPDLVLMDIMLSGEMDGIMTAEEITETIEYSRRLSHRVFRGENTSKGEDHRALRLYHQAVQ